jgi:hypothetical protein
MYHNNDNNNNDNNNNNNIKTGIDLQEKEINEYEKNEINEWINNFNYTMNQISCKSNDQNNTLITHAKYINTIDEKMSSYKEEIDNFNNTLTEIKDLIVDEFENYDNKFIETKKENYELNHKINKETYITNFLIIVVFILTTLLIFKDLHDSDVIANFTNFINEKNNTNINKVIETIIDDRVSEL